MKEPEIYKNYETEKFIEIFDNGINLFLKEKNLEKIKNIYMKLFVLYYITREIYEKNIDLFLLHSSILVEITYDIIKIKNNEGLKIIKECFTPLINFDKEPESNIEYLSLFMFIFHRKIVEILKREDVFHYSAEVINKTKYKKEILKWAGEFFVKKGYKL